MKRYFSLFTACLILLTFLFTVATPCKASASEEFVPDGEVLVSQTTQTLANGNMVTITISESPVSTYASSFAKNGSKTYALRKSNGEVLWTFTVSGVFTVTSGVSAVCTEATYSYNISNSNWYFKSASTSRSGNKAIGNAAFDRKSLFVVLETQTCEVVLTCDTNGNLS